MSGVDYTRPLMLGYARRDLYITDEQVEAMKEELRQFAQLEGFTRGTVYVEEADSAPTAYEALVASVNRYEVTAIVLPSLRHLGLLGDTQRVKRKFEQDTGARIMLPQPPTITHTP